MTALVTVLGVTLAAQTGSADPSPLFYMAIMPSRTAAYLFPLSRTVIRRGGGTSVGDYVCVSYHSLWMPRDHAVQTSAKAVADPTRFAPPPMPLRL